MKSVLQRLFRIKKRTEIKEILRCGKRYKAGNVTIIFTPNSICHDRYAILVGKGHGNSVARNRLKRVVREAIRKNPSYASDQFLNVIICPRRGIKSQLETFDREIKEWRTSLRP